RMRRVVVVDGAEVGVGVLPSVIRHDRARRVELLRQPVETLEESRLGAVVGILEAEGLVHRRPGADRRVPAVALNGGEPLGEEAPLSYARVFVEGGNLAPDKETEDVGPVEP